MMETPGVSFSVKLRLGMSDPQEWRALLPVLNSLPLRHITMHPRVARQQYGGDVNLDEFRCLLAGSVNPVVYNGDIRTPRDAERIYEEFPEIFGIMLGRGVLGRPSLATEIASGEEWSPEKRIAEVKKFHRCLLSHYESILCGDHQTLSKILPFWEYAEEEIGRKAWKAIKKAVNMAKYNTGVAMIAGS